MAKIKKAQSGSSVIRGTRKGLGVFKTEKERTTSGGIAEPYKYKRTSIDTTGYAKGKPSYKVKTEEGEGDKISSPRATSSKSKTVSRKDVPSVLSSLKKKYGGKVIKKSNKKKK